MSTFDTQYLYKHISTNATTVVKPNPGKLHSIVVNTIGATETVTVYDNTAGSGTVIAILSSAQAGTYIYDVMCNTGVTVVTAGTTAPDLTICYA